MKKMLTFLAVALIAAATQAATITWESGAVYLPESKDNTWANKAGKDALSVSLVLLTEAEYNALDLGDQVSAYKTVSGKTASGTGTTSKTGLASVSAGNGTVGVKEYAAMFATYKVGDVDYIIVGKGDGTPNDLGTTDGELYMNMLSRVGHWTPNSTTPVPEPCTAALLALGLAAVGLKRKVA